MKGTRQFRWFRLALCCIFAALVVRAQQAGDGQSAVKVRTPAPALQAELRLAKDKQRHKVALLGRDSDGLVIYRLEGSSRQNVLKPSAIRQVKMKFSYDKKAYRKAIKAHDWSGAGLVIARGIRPVLPFLDLRENNGVGTTLHAAKLIIRGADEKSKCALMPAGRAVAARGYKAAYVLARAASRAEWSSRAEEAQLLACMCLVHLGMQEKAEKALEQIAEPEPDTDDYGYCFLARAYALAAGEKYEEALEAAARAVDFETKDINVFPNALILTAQCYEKLGDWYRARDVYYALVRLFGKMHYETLARERLLFIMEKGHTKTDEKMSAKNVFFGNEEDLNARVNELLGLVKETKKKKTLKTEDLP